MRVCDVCYVCLIAGPIKSIRPLLHTSSHTSSLDTQQPKTRSQGHGDKVNRTSPCTVEALQGKGVVQVRACVRVSIQKFLACLLCARKKRLLGPHT